jgi:hypothetical protein
MKFHICNIEPQGYRWGHFLDDFCRLVCYSLETLGHTCSMGCNQIEPERTNIVFCGHLLGAPEHVSMIADSCRYIAVQHEVLNPSGVNLSNNPEHFQQVYLPFLRRAIGVWEGIPRNLVPLERLGIRAAFFRGGYHPALKEVPRKHEQDIDFLFYGSITPYRRQMLQQIADLGFRVVSVFDVRAPYRNDLIGRAKVNLAPMQGPGMQHFAYGRVCYLLNNRSLVVVERCEDQEWLEQCFVSSSAEHWTETCAQTLSRTDRESLRDEFSERFRLFPFTLQVERLLEQTFGSPNRGTAGDAMPPVFSSSPDNLALPSE